MSSNVIKLNQATITTELPQHYPHGGGLEVAAKKWGCAVDEVLDLSTGLHPDGAPDWLGGWLKEHASLIAHYPDTHGEPARSVLAEEFNVSPENVLITAGAQAVIEVIFQAMCWNSMAIRIPCYNEPIRCAKRVGCEVLPFEIDQPLPDADLLWLTSPANPFGDEIVLPQCGRVVLDESYMAFDQRRTLGVKREVIRIGSLTKSFCIPGLRLGYLIAERETIQMLNHWLPPWPGSTLALHLLPELIKEADQRDAQITEARARLIALLKKYHWEVKPSHASFILARSQKEMPDFSHYRIMVRQFPEWPQLSDWVRFGLPGSESEWRRLEEALCQ